MVIWQTEKNKIADLSFLFPAILIFILIMVLNIKNNKKFFSRAARGHILKLVFVKLPPIFAVLLL